MWKLVIADDERVIVKGLKKLIDWNALNVEIVGEAYNGEQLKKIIVYAEPDIVLADIMMPYATGLEVIEWDLNRGGKAKYIFVSGYQEFSYAKEAISKGAVDYLLKPVTQQDLTDAVKKAIRILEQQNTVEIFREDKDDFQILFEKINDGRNYENQEFYDMFRQSGIQFEDSFLVGITAGICPEVVAERSRESFSKYNLMRFSMFNRLTGAFASRKLGFALKKEEDALHIMGVFPKKDLDYYVEKYINPIRKQIEEECGTRLCMGIGTPTDDPSGMLQSHKYGKFAFELYRFRKEPIIDIKDAHWDFQISYDDYQNREDEVLKAILTKAPDALDKIAKVMDTIESIHYGNWKAVKTRTMNFTGEIGMQLDQYKLLDVDFYQMQDELQRKVEVQQTMPDLKECICRHYEELLMHIYENGKSQDKVLIREVKQYIREHYNEELSIPILAEVACVSPNYFSAMFKKETGQNYKAFLTDIRMEEAMHLIRETDSKTYQIAEQVGYNNVRRFVDTFKQYYGSSPMEYRTSWREQTEE